MRYLVLSDIHANTDALEACLNKAAASGYDRVVCCGDIVGYGPNPAEVMDALADLGAVCIRGNHDREVARDGDPLHFNIAAKRAVEWTRDQLPESYRRRLAELPAGPLAIAEGTQLVHGSARDEDEYVVGPGDAAVNLATTRAALTFFGHTHEPVVLTRSDRRSPDYDSSGIGRIPVPAERVLVNPGSVGQPRDGDARASFLIWDAAAAILEFHRTPYPIEKTQARMRDAQLPEPLITRLSHGR